MEKTEFEPKMKEKCSVKIDRMELIKALAESYGHILDDGSTNRIVQIIDGKYYLKTLRDWRPDNPNSSFFKEVSAVEITKEEYQAFLAVKVLYDIEKRKTAE